MACNNQKRANPGSRPDPAIVADFQQKLHTLNLSDDSLKAEKICALYNSAPGNVRNALCTVILSNKDKMLLTESTGTGLISFYSGLSSDSNLDNKNRALVNLRLARYYAYISGHPDSATYFLEKSNAHPEVLNDSFYAKWYSIAGQASQLRGQPRDAAAALYKAIYFNEKINDLKNIAGNNINLANIYRQMNDFSRSVALRKKALQYFTGIHDSASSVTAMQGLAADFLDMGRIDSAREYFTQCEALFAAGVRNPATEYYLYLTKAGMYVTLNSYDSSIYYFDKAKVILSSFHDPGQEMLFVIASTIAYSHERNVSREVALIENYIPRLLADNNIQEAKNVYFCLYNIALVQKAGHGSALDYYLAYDSLKTAMADSRNRDFTAEMESKYESQKKNLKIEVQQKEIQQRKALNAALILSLVTIISFTGIFFIRLQLVRSRRQGKMQQQFTRELLKNTEAERGRIAGELHDGISHELLSLKNNLQEGTAATEAKINMIINDIRMISRNLHPVMLDKIGFQYSVQHLCEQLMTSGQLFISAEIDYQKQLTPDGELQLYRIIQESLTNVIKYAHAMAAKVSVTSKDNKLLATIMDNGKGFDVAKQLNSGTAFGLHSIIQRSKALGGKATITSSAQGTVIHLEIPTGNGHYTHS